jgi:hypothetical protein
LKDSSHALMMDFVIPHDIRFSFPTHSIRLILVRGKDVVPQVVDKFSHLV